LCCNLTHKEAAGAALAVLVARAYDTVVSIIQAAAQKAQLVHNAEVQNVDTDAIAADELWSFVEKNKNTVCQRN
jgi:hypothetical protein